MRGGAHAGRSRLPRRRVPELRTRPLAGSTVPSAGSAAVDPDPTLREFLHELAQEFSTGTASSSTRSALLVAKPGELTREYLAGRRVRYISPLAAVPHVQRGVLLRARRRATGPRGSSMRSGGRRRVGAVRPASPSRQTDAGDVAGARHVSRQTRRAHAIDDGLAGCGASRRRAAARSAGVQQRASRAMPKHDVRARCRCSPRSSRSFYPRRRHYPQHLVLRAARARRSLFLALSR